MKRFIYFLNSAILTIALVLPVESFSQPVPEPIVFNSLETVAADILLVHYKFDESSGDVVADSSGNGYDGIITGNPEWVEGYLGNALEFKGADLVTLPAAEIGLTPYKGTVTFWLNADVPAADINTMFWAGDNTTGTGFGPENEMHVHLEVANPNIWEGGEFVFFAITTASDQLIFLHSDPDKGGADERATPPVNPILLGDLQWHHVAAVWDGDLAVATIYIDGEYVTHSDYTPGEYELSNIILGQMAYGNRPYTGKLDDLRIYSYALSDDDIENLYNNIGVHVPGYQAPKDIVLNQNYPNPFHTNTKIQFQLPKNNVHVSLQVYNSNGQHMGTLIDRNLNSGVHQVTFGADRFPSGIYFYKFQTGDFIQVRRMILLK